MTFSAARIVPDDLKKSGCGYRFFFGAVAPAFNLSASSRYRESSRLAAR
jgi:hypothetical protein